jgi:uncharacterized CHY-type Zn-finger protein
MAKAFCPHCDVMLTKEDLAEGRCRSCGKKLPRCPHCDAMLTQKDLDENRCDACGKKLPFCPFCDVLLTRKDVTEGWCDSCGNKLPPVLVAPPKPRGQPAKPAPQQVGHAGLYKFARRMEKICLAGLLFVLTSCGGVPVVFILIPNSAWPVESRSQVEGVIFRVQLALIFVLVASVLVAKGLKTLSGPDIG